MPDLKVTLIQSTLHWEDIEGNLEMFSRKIEAIEDPTDLILLPEMFTTGFSMNPSKFAEGMYGETMSWMSAQTQNKTYSLAGSVIIKEDGKYFNRLLHCKPDGSFSTYDKRHRFTLSDEHKEYTAGRQLLIETVNGWNVNFQICYDLRFPVWARNKIDTLTGKPLFDCLVYVANWPERRSYAWKQLLIARAIENQCFVVGVNRVGEDGTGVYHSGDSCAINPYGEIVFHSENEEIIHTATLLQSDLEKCRKNLLFLSDADKFEINNP